MSDGVQLHPTLSPLLQERRRIVDEHDQSRRQAGRLESLGGSLPPGSLDQAIAGAVGTDPPRDLDVAVAELERVTAEAEQHRGEIRSLEQQISGIKSQAQTTIILLVFAAIAIVVGLFFMIRAYM